MSNKDNTQMPIQTYYLSTPNDKAKMVETNNGAWMKVHDHTAAIDAKNAEIVKVRRERDECLSIVEAVAHIGIDWGYGEYQMLKNDSNVGKARKILEAIKQAGESND